MRDREAQFRQFVAECSPALLRLAHLLCADRVLAEDLLQTALLKTFARRRRIADPAAYARRVLVTASIDEGRRAHHRRERLVDRLPERDGRDAFDDVLERDRLRAALVSLPAGQRAAVVLRHWLDLDPAEAGRLLGCSPETVRSQAMRGLDKLRHAYGVPVARDGDHDA